MTLRQMTPRRVKISWQLLKRFVQYRWGNENIRFAKPAAPSFVPQRVVLSQPVRRSYLYENKLANLRLGGERVGRYVVRPGETFSFWRAVGPPTARRGFLPGRNLIGGELREDFGGGLCQLSGLLYHLSLLSGLEILERHNHSADIYQDDERFTPLGADATVVYGYRDLLIRNNFAEPVSFSVQVHDNQVVGVLHCTGPVAARKLEFRRVPLAGGGKVVFTLNEWGETLCRSVYK
ncbi:vancomycin resistance protein [Neolewinella aurantiaca]|uniref:Vancomycin resistance protein n=1 Tax=Neolewinella aurantiaca TaxID=2602767 RepID=A0A5C7FRK6_9BACT|nr:VanW family protein [Neolewinella aurantiaca]TXF88117.1 vancomycin resistance protein [Neolewinella aurantiaca]